MHFCARAQRTIELDGILLFSNPQDLSAAAAARQIQRQQPLLFEANPFMQGAIPVPQMNRHGRHGVYPAAGGRIAPFQLNPDAFLREYFSGLVRRRGKIMLGDTVRSPVRVTVTTR